MTLTLVFLVFAFVCFCLAAYFTQPKESKLVAVGLAFWVATEFLTQALSR